MLKAPKNFLGHAIFLLDHALKFTRKTLLLGGHALLYTVGNTIFDEKALLISASGPAGLETFLEETENKEKIQNICLSGPLKAPGPLVTTLATLLDGPDHECPIMLLSKKARVNSIQTCSIIFRNFPDNNRSLRSDSAGNFTK